MPDCRFPCSNFTSLRTHVAPTRRGDSRSTHSRAIASTRNVRFAAPSNGRGCLNTSTALLRMPPADPMSTAAKKHPYGTRLAAAHVGSDDTAKNDHHCRRQELRQEIQGGEIRWERHAVKQIHAACNRKRDLRHGDTREKPAQNQPGRARHSSRKQIHPEYEAADVGTNARNRHYKRNERQNPYRTGNGDAEAFENC